MIGAQKMGIHLSLLQFQLEHS